MGADEARGAGSGDEVPGDLEPDDEGGSTARQGASEKPLTRPLATGDLSMAEAVRWAGPASTDDAEDEDFFDGFSTADDFAESSGFPHDLRGGTVPDGGFRAT